MKVLFLKSDWIYIKSKVDFSLLYRFFVPNCEIFKTVLPVDFQVKLEFVLMPTKNKKQRINVFP